MVINSDKTKSMLFGTKARLCSHDTPLNVMINGQQLQVVKTSRVL